MKYIKLANSHICAICDDAAYEMLNQYYWNVRIHKNGKAQCIRTTNNQNRNITMQQLVMAVEEGILIDHKNHNIYDNRWENLRIATYSQNNANKHKTKNPKSSKYKGVYYSKARNCWIAEIKINSKTDYLGGFKTEIGAAKEYNKFAIKYFGEFACLNEFGDPLVGTEKDKGE